MKNTDLMEALCEADEEFVSETAPDRPYKRPPVLRVALIAAAAAAAVAILVTVLALTVFNKKEPERQTPTLPAASETENGGETEKQTAEPTGKTETTEKTEVKTTAEPTPAEKTKSGPTEPTTAYQTSSGGDSWAILAGPSIVGNDYLPYAVLKINNITEDRIRVKEPRYRQKKEADMRRVDCEVLYSHGYQSDSIGSGQYQILTIPDLVSIGAQFWFPIDELEALEDGSVVLCGIDIECIDNKYRLYAGCGLAGSGCCRFENGELLIDPEGADGSPMKRYLNACKTYYSEIRELLEEGKRFQNSDLYERFPEKDLMNGSTVEEAVEYLKWMSEAELVALDANDPWDTISLLGGNPCAVLRITGITNEQIHRSYFKEQQPSGIYNNYYINYPGNEADLRRVECEVLYCCGQRKVYLGDREYRTDTLAEVISKGAQIWFPEEYLSGLKEGDTVICGVMIAEMNGEFELYAGCNSTIRCNVFEGSGLQVDFSDPSNSTLIHYRSLLSILRSRKENGCDFVHQDLFDRIPSGRIENGATVEEVVDILKWFDEVSNVTEDEIQREHQELLDQLENQG